MKTFLRIIITIALLSISATLFAGPDQATTSTGYPYQWNWWGNIGMVLAGSKHDSSHLYNGDGIGTNASLNVIPLPYQLLTVSTTAQGGFNIFGSDSTIQRGVLYGVVLKNHYMMESLSAGYSYVRFSNEVDIGNFRDKHSKSTYGIPVQIQLFWTPLEYFGIGFVLFENFNHVNNFYGAGIDLQLGLLK